MNVSRNIPLIASHFVVLGLAYTVAQNFKPVTETRIEAPRSRTSSLNRNIPATSADGAQLLVEFRKAFSEEKSRYEELKESLPPAADMKAAAIDAIGQWAKATAEEDKIEAFALLQVRFYHWLRANPSEAMQFLSTSETGTAAMNQRNLLSILGMRVLPDVAREQGVMNSLDWLTMDPAGTAPMWTTLLSEMKEGGGLALFLKFEEALANTSIIKSSGYDGNQWLRQVGASVRFADKERLLDYLKLHADEARSMPMLLGFAGSGEAASTWIMDLIESGELPETIALSMKGGIGTEVMKQPMMDMEKRIAARRFTPGNENKPREKILEELVSNDVNSFLNEGRDWRFEFQHGTASLEEIHSSVDSALKISNEGREKARIALYRTLSEEDPEKALPLLDSLTEEQRREVMFSNTWQSYGSINPDNFIAFLNKLPEPVTEKEKQDRMQGWSWKVYGFLERHGDDYIDWVAELPSNPDKYAAINAIIWATRENPAKAAELKQRFYPKKP